MPKYVNQKSATLKSHNKAILAVRCTSAAAGVKRKMEGVEYVEKKNTNFAILMRMKAAAGKWLPFYFLFFAISRFVLLEIAFPPFSNRLARKDNFFS